MGAVNVFSNFLYPTYVNCPDISDVVRVNNSFLHLSISTVVLRSGSVRGLVKL